MGRAPSCAAVALRICAVGRAGRDGKRAEALALISEPTGWFEPADKQRQQFFQAQMQKQQQVAQQLSRQLPVEGEIVVVSQQFKQANLALALLHSQGLLEWQDPFHYRIERHQAQTFNQNQAIEQMQNYLSTQRCRWQFLLRAFGFGSDADHLQPGCGHCDRCRSSK